MYALSMPKRLRTVVQSRWYIYSSGTLRLLVLIMKIQVYK